MADFAREFCERALRQIDPALGLLAPLEYLSGGCINRVAKLTTSKGYVVIKWNEGKDAHFFSCEAKGLAALRNTQTLQVPAVVGLGELDKVPYILLEYQGESLPSADFWGNFGHQLALLHQTGAEFHGLDHDNYIGAAKQSNKRHAKWSDFFREERLGFQARQCQERGLLPLAIMRKIEALYPRLPDLMPEEPPSLLHGDLWSGNYLVGNNGEAAVIDAAVYYGNREAELAFTHMFGGFEQDFYTSYEETYPLQPGFEQRISLYNLYSLLVHLNLFGTLYLSAIEQTLKNYE